MAIEDINIVVDRRTSFDQIKVITLREYPKIKMMMKTLQELVGILNLRLKRVAFVLAIGEN